MYGDASTLGEERRWQSKVYEHFLDLLEPEERDPIRVEASVGQAIPELTSDA